MDTPPLTGKVGIVTGASRGIGAATARHLAGRGASVVLAARDRPALQAVADEITRAGGQAMPVPVDVTDDAAMADLVAQTVTRFGRLDLAVNSAGYTHPMAPLADLDTAAVDETIAVNLRGAFLALKHQIPAIVDAGGGAIVTIASTTGVQASAGLAGYVAAKFGVVGLTKAAALDYADAGVRVNALAPGPILTDRLRQAGEQAQRMAGRAMPLGRIGRPDEVAAAAVWLCSPAASYLTGTVIPVDGGKLAGSPAMPRGPAGGAPDAHGTS